MLQAAFERETVVRSLKVALVVGTALNLINQGDAMLNNEHINIFKGLLTYAVPLLRRHVRRCVRVAGEESQF